MLNYQLKARRFELLLFIFCLAVSYFTGCATYSTRRGESLPMDLKASTIYLTVGTIVYGTDKEGQQVIFPDMSGELSRTALDAAKELLSEGGLTISETSLFIDYPESSYRARDPRFLSPDRVLPPPLLAEPSSLTTDVCLLKFMRSVNADVSLFSVNTSVSNRPWQNLAEDFRKYSNSRYLILLKAGGPATSESNRLATIGVNTLLIGLSLVASAAGGSAPVRLASSKKLRSSFEGVVIDIEKKEVIKYYRITKKDGLSKSATESMCRSVLEALLEEVEK